MRPTSTGCRLIIDPAQWGHRPDPGDSIAVSGCCLTVVEDQQSDTLSFDVIQQTLTKTRLGAIDAADRVNLEPAATLASRLDGHLVQGHVDAIGRVVAALDTPDQGRRLRLEAPVDVLDLCVQQGSIAIDGVSLTIADLGDTWLEVALIPMTLELTTLGDLREGNCVNIETDMLARHVQRLLRRGN
ncbi:MAG: riboflavin synthase [Phycisphaerales bacterium]|nr:riboflavin synthase [Phycisphaerales bacterium]